MEFEKPKFLSNSLFPLGETAQRAVFFLNNKLVCGLSTSYCIFACSYWSLKPLANPYGLHILSKHTNNVVFPVPFAPTSKYTPERSGNTNSKWWIFLVLSIVIFRILYPPSIIFSYFSLQTVLKLFVIISIFLFSIQNFNYRTCQSLHNCICSTYNSWISYFYIYFIGTFW